MGDKRSADETQDEPKVEPSDVVPFVTSAQDAPTVYADALWFVADYAGVVRLTFLENMLEPDGSLQPGMKARHVGTLVMPSSGFDGMIQYLIQRRDLFKSMATPGSNAD